MYRAFNLTISASDEEDLGKYFVIGAQLKSKNRAAIRRRLQSFLRPDGVLDGSGIQANWFPQIIADVFISHSHGDAALAISLAGWLSEVFGIEAFIDSCIWGFADDLLKEIDNAYCLSFNRATYNYQKRNRSTSHVHAMLSTALGMMMDKTECVFFLNTPQSIQSSEAVAKTKSPWIFTELAAMQVMRRNSKESHRKQLRLAKALKLNEAQQALEIEYPVNLSSLVEIDIDNLNEWSDAYSGELFPLDALYEIVPEVL